MEKNNLNMLGTYETSAVSNYLKKSCYKLDKTLSKLYEDKYYNKDSAIFDILLDNLFETKFENMIKEIGKEMQWRNKEKGHQRISHYGYKDRKYYFPFFFVYPSMPNITKEKYSTFALLAAIDNPSPPEREGLVGPNQFVFGAIYNNTKNHLQKETKVEFLSAYGYSLLKKSGKELEKSFVLVEHSPHSDGGYVINNHFKEQDMWYNAKKSKKISSQRYNKKLFSILVGELSSFDEKKSIILSSCAKQIDSLEDQLENPIFWKKDYDEYTGSKINPPQYIIDEKKRVLDFLNNNLTKFKEVYVFP